LSSEVFEAADEENHTMAENLHQAGRPSNCMEYQLLTQTPGLILRRLTAADADAYYAMVDCNRAHLSQYGDYQAEKVATLDWVISELSPPSINFRYGIHLGDRMIGRVDLVPVAHLHYTIGYWLRRDSTGRGYAIAACTTVIEYARTALSATDIFAGVTHGNHRSIALLKRLGFRPVAEFATYTRFQLCLTPVTPTIQNS